MFGSKGSAGNPAESRFLRAESLQSAGRWDEAIVAFAGIRGEVGGAALGCFAWERIAAIHDARGERLEALRALLKSRDLTDARGRARLAPRVDAALSRLKPGERAHISRELSGSGLVSDPSPSAPLRVALLAPLSGRFENFGRAFHLGAQIALADRERIGPAVELEAIDTGGDVVRTSIAARDAIVEKGSVALLGPLLSVPTLVAGAVAEGHRIPLVTPAISESRLAELGPWVHVLAPSPSGLARTLVRAAIAERGVQRVVALAPKDSGSKARVAELARELEARGGALVESISYDSGEKDFRTALAGIRKTKADAVYLLGDSADLETLAGQLDGAALGRTVLGNGEWGDAKIRRFAKRALEGAVFALEAGESMESEFSRSLAEKVRSRSGGDLSRFHVFGYEAMDEVLQSIDRGARDSDEIHAMLCARAGWETQPAGRVLGAWTIQTGELRPLEEP